MWFQSENDVSGVEIIDPKSKRERGKGSKYLVSKCGNFWPSKKGDFGPPLSYDIVDKYL